MRSSDALTTPSSGGSEHRRRWPGSEPERAFHIFILRHSASLFIFPSGLSVALQRLHPHRHSRLHPISHSPTFITASAGTTIGVTRATLTLVPLSALLHTPPSSADPLLSGRPSARPQCDRIFVRFPIAGGSGCRKVRLGTGFRCRDDRSQPVSHVGDHAGGATPGAVIRRHRAEPVFHDRQLGGYACLCSIFVSFA
ncbi:hypothetical protein EDB83DRAFT_825128 [Lactarius deliciosus]|nr:hypothetical protein EDB83DRAFT_825128 [Lactarius deliciosus]